MAKKETGWSTSTRLRKTSGPYFVREWHREFHGKWIYKTTASSVNIAERQLLRSIWGREPDRVAANRNLCITVKSLTPQFKGRVMNIHHGGVMIALLSLSLAAPVLLTARTDYDPGPAIIQ